MITLKVPEAMHDKISNCLATFKFSENTSDDITVFQDFNTKNDYGIPSGVKLESVDKVYPCAVPDLGCGFRVIKMDGIQKSDLLNNEALMAQIEKYLKTCNNGSDDMHLDVALMARQGHLYMRQFFHESREAYYDNSGCFEIGSGHETNTEIFTEQDLNLMIKTYQGHFLEILEPRSGERCVYLLIHTGSFTLADRFKQFYYPKMAKISYENNWASKSEILNETFFVHKSHDIIFQYYNDAKMLMNFAVAYRDLVEIKLLEILKRELEMPFKATLLSDVLHTKITINAQGVIHQRGVQELISPYRPYIISGNASVASMLFFSNSKQYASHGIQTDMKLLPSDLEDADYLISNEQVDENRSQLDTQASGAKCVYDYYLAQSCTLIDYLLPFYTFKHGADHE